MKLNFLPLILLFVFVFCTHSEAQLGNLKQKAKGALQKQTSKKDANSPSSDLSSEQPAHVIQSGAGNADEEDEKPAAPRSMIFSNKPIQTNAEASQQLFKANERMYGRFVFSKSLREITGLSGEAQISVFMKIYPYNGTSTHLATYNVNDKILNQNYFDIEILADPATATWVTPYYPDRYGYRISDCKPGKYKLRFTLSAEYQPFAWGEVEYDMTTTDFKKLAADEQLAFTNASANWAKNLALPVEFSRPAGRFAAPELSTAGIKKILLRDWAGVAEIKKLVVADEGGPDWSVNKGSDGAIDSKVTNKSIYVAWKGKDGKCYYTLSAYLVMDYEGGGRYGGIRAGTSSQGIVPIGCDNIR